MKESGEMYLETILILGKRTNIVRAVDVAEEMGISKASVSRALGKLKDEACLIVDQAGHIGFTEKGRGIAERIYERHQILTQVLMMLGVDEKTATADACKMEHDVSDRSFAAIKEHMAKYR